MFVANSDQLLGRWLVDDFDYFRKIFIEPKLGLFRNIYREKVIFVR